MIINRIYEHENLLLLVPFLVGLRTYQHAGTTHLKHKICYSHVPIFEMNFSIWK